MSPLPYTLMLNSETGVDCTRHDLKGLHRTQDLGIAFENEAANILGLMPAAAASIVSKHSEMCDI